MSEFFSSLLVRCISCNYDAIKSRSIIKMTSKHLKRQSPFYSMTNEIAMALPIIKFRVAVESNNNLLSIKLIPWSIARDSSTAANFQGVEKPGSEFLSRNQKLFFCRQEKTGMLHTHINKKNTQHWKSFCDRKTAKDLTVIKSNSHPRSTKIRRY